MEDNNIKVLIRTFLEGRLSQENEEKLLDWVKSDPSKKQLFHEEQFRLAPEMMSRQDPGVKEGIKSVNKRISENRRFRKNNLSVLYYSSVAAAFVIGIVLSVVIIPAGSLKKAEPVLNQVSVPFGAKSHFTLPDSSTIWLNSGSRFSYPAEFGQKREVQLFGEAYFEVAKNSRPFIIKTHHGQVEVTGTTFDVQAYPGNGGFTTTLVEGSLQVTRDNSTVTLKPGEQAYVSGNELKTRKVNTELFTSWKDGKLIFVREPFPVLMKKLEQWYNVKIDYNDPSLGSVWYTGTIEMETITEVMEMVSKAAHVKYSFNSKTRVITVRSK